jgi:DNA-binding beta-propeller fold protein YncE
MAPTDIAVNPNNSMIYVTNLGSSPDVTSTMTDLKFDKTNNQAKMNK